jgi:pimeloyl-ACP methyl ester carboxylesterase
MHRSFLLLAAVIALVSTTIRAQVSATPEHSSTSLSSSHIEDWTTIYLAQSRLPLNPPGAMPLAKADMPGGCTRELLRLQWRPNDPIDLYVIRPAGAKKIPVVLFLYNYTSDNAVFRETRWCERAVENGFAVVGLSSALSWERMRPPRPMKQWFVSELQEALATSTHDVQMVLNYLETRDDLDVHRIGMFGQGSGGAVAILAAAADPRIAVLDLMDPWGDWPDWLQGSRQIPDEERPAYLKREFLEQLSTLDPLDHLAQLEGRAIRIQQVLADPVTPAAAKDRIAAAAPAADMVSRYPTGAAEAEALGRNGIMGWLGTELHATASK